MYAGKRASRRWLLPLLRHAGTNAAGMILVVIILHQSLLAATLAGAVDLIFHAAIDRAKRYLDLYFAAHITRAIDQSLHQLTYLFVSYFIFS